MGGLYVERRSGRDRRLETAPPPEGADRRGAERRQFPPPDDPRAMSPAAGELQKAIDAFKLERRLARITVPDLLGLLGQLGYRKQ